MASLAAVTRDGRSRSRILVDTPTVCAVAASSIFSLVFIARSAFTVGTTTYFSLFDDAMVSMRYARNLAHGDGLVWNANQPAVEGYTNFLWTLWMAVLHLTQIPESTIALLVMLSGAVLLAGNVVVIGMIARELGATSVVRTIALFSTALYYPLAYWTLRGMEVGLLAFVVSSATLLSLRLARAPSRRDLVWLCALLVTGSLTRPDAALLMLCFVVYVAWCGGQDRLRLGLPLLGSVVLPTVALTVFREAYYHALLPNTYYLKMSGEPLAARLHRGLVAIYELELGHLWAPTIAAAALFIIRGRVGRRFGLLLLLIVTAFLYSAYVGGDAWEWMNYSNRYVAPVVPLLLVLAAFGVGEVTSKPIRKRTVWRTLAIATAAILTSTFASELLTRGVAGLKPAPPGAFVPLVVFLLGAAAISLRRGGIRPSGSVTLAVGVLSLVVALNLVPARYWVAKNGYHVADDADAARRGLELRAETAETTTIAVVWAGAIPYFSHRPAVDLLGKSDTVVARLPARRPFFPGHSKWDYSYSIGKLRPDVIAQGLWRPDRRDVRMLRQWGYRAVTTPGPWPAYVRGRVLESKPHAGRR